MWFVVMGHINRDIRNIDKKVGQGQDKEFLTCEDCKENTPYQQFFVGLDNYRSTVYIHKHRLIGIKTSFTIKPLQIMLQGSTM